MGGLSTGYGTYISAGVLAFATLAHQFGWINDTTYQTLLGLAGAGGFTFLRAATAKADTERAAGQALIAEHLPQPVPPVLVATVIKPPVQLP